MKKQFLYIPLNIILALLILGGVGFALYNAMSKTMTSPEPMTVAAVEQTQAARSTKQEAVHQEKLFKIGIIQHTDNEQCNACYEGFIAKLAQRGYINSNNIDVDYVLETDEKKCIAAVSKMVNDKPDIIYSIGGFTTRELQKATDDIPVVFAAVVDPEAEGFVDSNEEPGGNITGVSSFIPTFEQIDAIKFLLPKAKKIGAIYDATNETSVLQSLIAKSEAESDEMKLSYEKYPVIESSEITSKLDEIEEDGDIDVLYLPVDALVIEDIGEILDFAKDKKIPTICGNEMMLEEGGFATALINYTSMGRKSADLVVDIMVNGKLPSTMPVVYKYDCDVIINSDVMKDLGISLTEEADGKVEVKKYD